MYHDQMYGEMYNGMLTWPFVSANVITDPTVPWYSPYNAVPFNGVLPPVYSPMPKNSQFPEPVGYVGGWQLDNKPMGIAQWNLSVERQLGQGFLLRTTYEASQSWHVISAIDMNAPVYIPGNNPDGTPKSTGDNVPQRRPYYPVYGQTIGVTQNGEPASYNALAISVEKRMTGRLSLLSGYRWGKCTNIGTVTTWDDGKMGADPNDRNLDHGICTSDIASQIKASVVYRLPSLRSWGFVGRNVLGGWSMSGIWTWHDGFPYTIIGSVDSTLDGSPGNRAAIVGNPNLPGGRSEAAKLQEWFNTAAFANPPVWTPSGSARNMLRGPGFFNLDYALIKSFPIRYGPLKETQKIDFRAESFNISNHPNFGNPDRYVGDPYMGQISSARDPRILQFALKYIF
jgi:hypothetical protein